jgi:RNA 3'-terminal phosphate cyclase (ATP)
MCLVRGAHLSSFITIDGSQGEGGGQILRTSLALSLVTGQPFRVERIRAGREKPGLMRQHLVAVSAAAAVCGAEVDGAAIGSGTLTFTPGKVKAGEYKFSIGSAGSTTLVLQTVLPALMIADAPSTITLEGGTHNPFAPPVDFIDRVFLPVIRRMGPAVNIALERAGFYPAGGGRVIVNIKPVARDALVPFRLEERGEATARVAYALVAGLPGDIAKRELAKVKERLGWADDELKIRQLPQPWGPGNVLLLEVTSEQVNEIFSSFGMRSITSEAVAESAAQQVREYLTAGAPVGPYLADQLLIPLALAGAGRFVTSSPTRHSMTNIDVIARFLDVRMVVESLEGGCAQITCE